MINSLGFRQNAYGNIQRVGVTKNGRVIYRVINSKGEEAGRLTVPNNETDTFESAYRDVMESAPKIQKFVRENSSEDSIKKRRNISRAVVCTGGATGAFVPLVLTKNIPPVKRILATVAGIIAGISVGFAASIAITAPPGSYKFAKASRTFSNLDIQTLDDF